MIFTEPQREFSPLIVATSGNKLHMETINLLDLNQKKKRFDLGIMMILGTDDYFLNLIIAWQTIYWLIKFFFLITICWKPHEGPPTGSNP